MKILDLPKRLILLLIRFYQLFFSPDHSWLKVRCPYGFCRYYPSCSEYAKRSIIKNGVARGLFKSFYRIIRCNPLSQGGIDLP